MPASTKEVQALVQTANRYGTPLYPISTGKNWGLGSRLPIQDQCAVVELSRMNRIIEVNEEEQYAVIEPGVTQKQLYDYLQEHAIPLLINVTGSSADTSIIGNSLERGIGYFESRADALSGMEVVLGNGEIVRTGFGHYAESSSTYIYHHGVGPSIDGLFSQSNFGIVTSAGFALMPKPEAQSVVVIRIDHDNKLGRLTEALAGLLKNKVTDSVIHIGNDNRSHIAMGPLIFNHLVQNGMSESEARESSLLFLKQEGFGPWSALAGLMGTKGQVKLAQKQIRSAMRGIGCVTFLTKSRIAMAKSVLSGLRIFPTIKRKIAILTAVEALFDYSSCVPSSAAMQSVWWPMEKRTYPSDHEPDSTRSGILYVVPFCPLRERDVTRMVQIANTICETFGFLPYITLNTVNSRCVEAVINIAFNRDDATETHQAQMCADRMLKAYLDEGMVPYRVGVQDMSKIVQEDDSFWRTIRDLKLSVDPNGIIAPGRYNLV